MRRRGFLALALAVLANECSISLLPSANARRMATPEATEVPQPSVTPQTPTVAATATAKASPTLTETPLPTATSTRTPEPTQTPEPTNVPKPEGIAKLGPEMVAQMVYSGEPRNRWEYKGVAYWDNGKGRLELVEGIDTIDIAGYKELFVKLDVATVEEMVIASGYTAMPIPLDVDSGVMRQRRGGQLWSVVFQEVEGAAIIAPFGGRVIGVGSEVWGVNYEKLTFSLKDESGAEFWFDTLYEGNLPNDVVTGQVITVVGEKKLPYTDEYASESVF